MTEHSRHCEIIVLRDITHDVIWNSGFKTAVESSPDRISPVVRARGGVTEYRVKKMTHLTNFLVFRGLILNSKQCKLGISFCLEAIFSASHPFRKNNISKVKNANDIMHVLYTS